MAKRKPRKMAKKIHPKRGGTAARTRPRGHTGRRDTGKRQAAKGRKPSSSPAAPVLLRKGGQWAIFDAAKGVVRVLSLEARRRLANLAGYHVAKGAPTSTAVRELARTGWKVFGRIVKNPALSAPQAAAARLVKRFSHREPSKAWEVPFRRPRALVYLGEAKQIRYVSDKEGRPRLYFHDLGRGAKLYCDETGRGWLYIHRPGLTVQARGIVG